MQEQMQGSDRRPATAARAEAVLIKDRSLGVMPGLDPGRFINGNA